jgi:hypothetical protein
MKAMSTRFHKDRHAEIRNGLARYEHDHGALPGITQDDARMTLVDQMISSLRRVEYVHHFRYRPTMSPDRIDPHSSLFDPLRGAFFLEQKGKRDEAVWQAFVGTHFGKHTADGWKLARNVMGSFGGQPTWTASEYTRSAPAFDAMLKAHQEDLRDPAVSGRFSNHRQYQSKRPDVIAKVFATFHAWEFADGGFDARLRRVHQRVGQEPTAVFRELYWSMEAVYGFGRLGRFDLLTMLGKLNIAPIEADSVHLSGATGPLRGAKLLVLGDSGAAGKPSDIEASIDLLDDYLGVGKQVLEDSLCNWQKSPTVYRYFTG